MMFLMFLGALIVGFVLFKLGVYSAIVSIFVIAFKAGLVIVGIAIAVYLYREFKGTSSAPSLTKPKG